MAFVTKALVGGAAVLLAATGAGCSQTQSPEEFCTQWNNRVAKAERTFEMITPQEARDFAAEAPTAEMRQDLLTIADADEAFRSLAAAGEPGDPAKDAARNAALLRVKAYCTEHSVAPSP